MSGLWRNRDYMLLWSGQLVSALGSSVSVLALPLLVLAITGSPAQTGLAAVLETIPYVLLALPAGALVDRWDRKRVMVWSEVGRAISFAVIPLADATGHLSLPVIYLAVTVHGVLMTFFTMAEVAALAQVVSKEQLPAATAQNGTNELIGTIAGPPLGGAIFQSLGHTVPFLVDAISYVASVVSLLFIRTRFQQERTGVRRYIVTEIAEGVRWLWGNRLVRFLAVVTGSTNFVFAGVILMLIFLARGMGASPAQIGILYTVSAIGGLAGTLATPYIQRTIGFRWIVVVFIWIQALLFPLLAFAPNLAVIGVIGVGLFSVSPVYNTAQMSYRLGLIPDELQGRVNSVYRLIAFALNPLGAGLAGLLTQWIGAAQGVVLLSSVLIVIAIWATVNRDLQLTAYAG